MKTRTSSGGPARRTRQVVGLALGASLLAGCSGLSRAAELPVDPDILQQLRSFATLGSVLYIAAHPDDENTRVITYLARGRGYRTAYLSLTRGDGGQNLLGPQFREQLGVARTQELLAARRLDGGRQYFTRAKDFGFSKDYQDTLRIWDRQAVLADIVRVIRSFRPDVIVTRFSPQSGNTHGHHTASTVLAVEAFKLAGDPRAFPEQLGELTPWQPKRILHNVGVGGAGAGAAGGNGTGVVKMEIGGNDPVLGESFASIAARSRAMHKTQGFGMGDFAGDAAVVGGSRIESFLPLGGESATHDILDGVDTTWNRVPGGAEIGRLTEEAIARFKPEDPMASVPALLAIRSRMSVLPADSVVSDKRQQLDRIVQAFIGLEVETLVDQPEAVPGETLKMRHTAVMRSRLPVRWTAVRYPSIQRAVTKVLELRVDQPVVRDETQVLPTTTPPSQPYWLRRAGTAAMFHVDDPSLIGRPENPAAFPIEYVFDVGGQTLVISGEPVQAAADPANATMRRRLDVIPPVSLRFVSDVQLFAPGAARPVTVELTAARASVAGTVQLEGPTGWRITAASQPFHLAGAGEHARFTFTVTAPAQPATAILEGSVEVNGVRFNTQRIGLRYDHIPFQLLQPVARLKAVSLDLAIRGRHIGYLPGAGDDVAGGLERMGYAVTQLTGADLIPDKLRPLDAVVIGIRAFNTRKDLAGHLPALFEYVEAGGNVIAQYNLSDGLGANWLAPFRLRISRERVTDEHASVTFLAPDHPVLTTPNRITRADFDGWVQERGLYFPDQWDERFTAILASGDPGEMPLRGGLLVARHGKGYFVYTSLAWFRQLPEGVPGAYRLFANLVSLGK
ncbi:MAG: PIG-L family deacetylase [Candidatus Rokubacteria bacterium]|nr:PIG-L family deacetylase [Candidatus Rokubacteria bacterium]